MNFRSDEDARLKVFETLRKQNILLSTVDLIEDPRMTICVNLQTYGLKIGRRFLYKTIRDYADIKFLVQHEVFHRYISNQWNKFNWINEIMSYAPKTIDIKGVDWKCVNIAEDAFINNYIRNSGMVTSDFPEYYYTMNTDDGMPITTNKWLCKVGSFDDPNVQWYLDWIRNVSEFQCGLGYMATIYWFIKNQEDQDKQDGTNEDKKGLQMVTTDKCEDGEEVEYGTPDEQHIVEVQEEQKQESDKPSVAGSGRYKSTNYVPDASFDSDISKVFDVRTKDMVNLERIGDGCKVLVDYIEGTLEQSREIATERYLGVNLPNSLSRHDMIMSGLGTDPIYWEHQMPLQMGEDNKEIKWDIYIDCSGSMQQEVPLARFVSKQLEHLCNKMYVFSNAVWEYNGGNWYNTTGGTDYRVAIEHAESMNSTHVLFIGDGEDQFTFDYWKNHVYSWWQRIESLFIIINKSQKYINQGKEVFNHCYDYYGKVMHSK